MGGRGISFRRGYGIMDFLSGPTCTKIYKKGTLFMLSLEKDCFPKCYLKISASRSVPLPQSNRMRGVINGASSTFNAQVVT